MNCDYGIPYVMIPNANSVFRYILIYDLLLVTSGLGVVSAGVSHA